MVYFLNCGLVFRACDSDPCVNAVACVNLKDAFSCHCEEGYTGYTCAGTLLQMKDDFAK